MFTSRGGGGNICICEPSDLKDGFHFAKSKDEIESVLAKIEKIYSRSKLPKHASRNGCCSCVGLLAPPPISSSTSSSAKMLRNCCPKDRRLGA